MIFMVKNHLFRRSLCILLAIAFLSTSVMPVAELAGASSRGMGPRALGDPWWDAQWSHRKEITVSNGGAGKLYSFPVKLEVQYTNYMDSNFSDIRFLMYNSTSGIQTKLAYWVEASKKMTNASVWVNITEIPAGGSATLYMYYGNPTAISESNGPRTFDLFDDFNNGDISNWTLDTSCITGTNELNGTLYHSPPYSLLNYLMNACGNDQYSFSKRLVDLTSSNYDLAFYARSHECMGCTVSAMVLIDGWPNFDKYDPGPELHRYNISLYIYSGWHTITVGMFTTDSQSGIFPAWFDDIILRKITSQPPSATFGPEESAIQVVLKALSYQPKKPSENDTVKVTAEFHNPMAVSQHLLISFRNGDNFVSAVKFGEKWMDIAPSSDSSVSADWTAVGGTQKIWCTVNGTSAGNIWIKVNRYPKVLTMDDQNATEYTPFETVVRGEDLDGDPFNWSVNNARFTIINLTNNTARLDFLPIEQDVPFVNITINATDVFNKTGSKVFTIKVKDVNDPPSILPIPDQKAMVGILFRYQVQAIDPDTAHGDKLKFGSTPSFVAINAFTGLINFTPTEQYVGTFNVTIKVVDGGGLPNSTNFTLVVTQGQHPPKLVNPGDQTLTEGKPYNLTVTATDPDKPYGDWLQFFDDTDMFTIGKGTGRIDFTPSIINDGVNYVNITVKDSEGLKDTIMVRFIVLAIPHPPVLGGLYNVTLRAYEEWDYNLTANDPDLGEKLVFSGQCDLFSIPSDGKIRFKPSNKQAGIHQVNITVTDPTGLKDNGSFWITVEFRDRPPWNVRILTPAEEAEFPPGSVIRFSATVIGSSPSDLYTYRWLEGEKVLGSGPVANISLEPGTHFITVEVSDGTASVNRTIIVLVNDEGTAVGSLLPCLSLVVPCLLSVMIVLVLEYLAVRRREKAELDAYRQELEKKDALAKGQKAQAIPNGKEMKIEVRK
jgi:hypothetical protein